MRECSAPRAPEGNSAHLSARALTGAARNGHLKVVRLLCKKCLNRCRPDDALEAAAANGHAEVVKTLRSRCDEEAQQRAFITGTTSGFLNVMRALPAGLMSDSELVSEALFKAGANGHADVVEFILQIEQDDIDFEYMRAFATADNALLSLDDRVQIQLGLPYGSTGVSLRAALRPLVAAAERGHSSVLQVLLQRCGQEQIGLVAETAALRPEWFELAAEIPGLRPEWFELAADTPGLRPGWFPMLEMAMEAYEPSAMCFEASCDIAHRLHNDVGSPACGIGRALLRAVTNKSVAAVKLLAGKAPICVVGMAKRSTAAAGCVEIVQVLAQDTRECSLHPVAM